jgi:hypothetical protein
MSYIHAVEGLNCAGFFFVLYYIWCSILYDRESASSLQNVLVYAWIYKPLCINSVTYFRNAEGYINADDINILRDNIGAMETVIDTNKEIGLEIKAHRTN